MSAIETKRSARSLERARSITSETAEGSSGARLLREGASALMIAKSMAAVAAAAPAVSSGGCDGRQLFGALAAFSLLSPLLLFCCPYLFREPGCDEPVEGDETETSVKYSTVKQGGDEAWWPDEDSDNDDGFWWDGGATSAAESAKEKVVGTEESDLSRVSALPAPETLGRQGGNGG